MDGVNYVSEIFTCNASDLAFNTNKNLLNVKFSSIIKNI